MSGSRGPRVKGQGSSGVKGQGLSGVKGQGPSIVKGLSLIILSALLCCSCHHNSVGHIKLNYSFVVDKDSLRLDTNMYQNAAGNLYEVNDVQFFISKVMLLDNKGNAYAITDNQGIHYTDIRIPNTLTWQVSDDIPAGSYSQISFVFGLEGEQNATGNFPNPPENNMSWPQMLGGGYHYMKINGRWIDPDGVRQPFNFHMGRISDGDGFADNTFTVTLPLDHFSVVKDQTSPITLQMDINRWFSDPNVFDFNVFGGSIMQNREAQIVLRENGWNVFGE